ncbi:hypothetical protein GD429_17750 [Burkholderia sp. BE17]|nr:hypothetical protein [Burkholderia sp. BE17]
MDYRVSYKHSLRQAPDDFIGQVAAQLITDVPANIPRALLPEYIADAILDRLVHQAHKLPSKGESMRKTNAQSSAS